MLLENNQQTDVSSHTAFFNEGKIYHQLDFLRNAKNIALNAIVKLEYGPTAKDIIDNAEKIYQWLIKEKENGESQFIVQEWRCKHPLVDNFWLSGSTSENPKNAKIYFNVHFLLKDQTRTDITNLESLEEAIMKAEKYCKSLPLNH